MAQFTSKGFDALLAATQSVTDLHLTLLWRGHLVEEIRQRIGKLEISDRVTVIDQTVDVNAILAHVHAAAIFATAPGLIKSYPHSLLDALAAGKPVMLSDTIPMSDYVKKEGCGVVIESVTPEAIAVGVAQLRAGYGAFASAALRAGQRDFTEEAALEAARAIYAAAQQKTTRP
jgi:glycosyltransferase involved in cell wall biosynthesis